jgi:hypothetical protein
MRGKRHDNQVVAKVVADLLLGQESQRQIAENNGISPVSVTDIKERYFEDFERLKNTAPEFTDINNLATGLLVQSLVTLTVQLEHFGNKEWLKTQPAGELANLHGVINDKTVRLLAAAQSAQQSAETHLVGPQDPDQGQEAYPL